MLISNRYLDFEKVINLDDKIRVSLLLYLPYYRGETNKAISVHLTLHVPKFPVLTVQVVTLLLDTLLKFKIQIQNFHLFI